MTNLVYVRESFFGDFWFCYWKVVFFHLSVSHSVHGGWVMCVFQYALGQTPTGQTPPWVDTPYVSQHALGQTSPPTATAADGTQTYWNAYLFTLKATSEIATKTHIGLILILNIWRTLISPFMGPLFRYTVTSTMGSKEVSFLEIYQMYFVRLDEFMWNLWVCVLCRYG